MFDYRLQQPVTPLTRIDLGEGVTGRIVTYRRPIMDALAASGAQFVRFDRFLDEYIDAIDQMETSKVSTEYRRFRTYYFDHNEDPEREASFEARLAASP